MCERMYGRDCVHFIGGVVGVCFRVLKVKTELVVGHQSDESLAASCEWEGVDLGVCGGGGVHGEVCTMGWLMRGRAAVTARVRPADKGVWMCGWGGGVVHGEVSISYIWMRGCAAVPWGGVAACLQRKPASRVVVGGGAGAGGGGGGGGGDLAEAL